jgi:hypothetical protein
MSKTQLFKIVLYSYACGLVATWCRAARRSQLAPECCTVQASQRPSGHWVAPGKVEGGPADQRSGDRESRRENWGWGDEEWIGDFGLGDVRRREEAETWRRQKTAHMNCWTDRIFFVALWSLDLGEIVAPIYRNTSCIFFQHLLLVYMSKIWKEPLWGSTCRRGVGGSSPPCPPPLRDRV